jgi:hypothetical protein
MSRAYVYRYYATIEITAENVAQADSHARKLRIVGAGIGARRPPKNRDSTAYSVKILGESVRRNEEP